MNKKEKNWDDLDNDLEENKSKYEKVNKKKANNKNNNIKKIKNSVAIICIVVIIFVINQVIVLINNPSKSYIVTIGKISKEETLEFLIIRDENIIENNEKDSEYEKIVSDGEKVAKNEKIMKVYSEQSSENYKQKEQEINQKIEDEISKLSGNISQSDTKEFDSQIEKIVKDMDVTDYSAIEEKKQNIDELKTKKIETIAKKYSNNQSLKNLINEKNDLEKKQSEDSSDILANRSGFVSYRIDGLEDKIKPDNLEKYTKKYIDNLNLENGKIIKQDNEKAKIIDSSNIYLACTTNSDEAKNAKENAKVKIMAPSGEKIDAKLVKINNNPGIFGEKTLIFEIEDQIPKFDSYRKVNMNLIWWEGEGYKVPNTAIFEDKNGNKDKDGRTLKYVLKKRENYGTKVLIKILMQGNEESIITNYGSTELEKIQGLDKNAETSISLYDEIEEKPTEKQIENAN